MKTLKLFLALGLAAALFVGLAARLEHVVGEQRRAGGARGTRGGEAHLDVVPDFARALPSGGDGDDRGGHEP